MLVATVIPVNDYKLEVSFDDSISGIIDLKSFIDTESGIFKVLLNKDLFNSVYTTGYSIAWNEELEIDALTVYEELVNKTPENAISGKPGYATN